MARKVVVVTIEEEGRDKGRAFVITEMPALQAEAWAIKVLQGIARSGVSIPPSIVAGWGILAMLGYKALQGMPYAEMAPLLDEMLLCVEGRPDATKLGFTQPFSVNPAEEVMTIIKLRKAVWDLHAGFFEAVFRSNFQASDESAAETTGSTPTSPQT